MDNSDIGGVLASHDGILWAARRVIGCIFHDKAMFICNRCPMRAVSHGISPCQICTGKKPLLAKLMMFYLYAYETVSKEKSAKFEARLVHCRFLGYSDRVTVYMFE